MAFCYRDIRLQTEDTIVQSTLGAVQALYPNWRLLEGRAPADAGAGDVFLTEKAVDGIPGHWIVFCPADSTEAAKCARLAAVADRPVLIAVEDTAWEPVTSDTDVVDAGAPNLYSHEGCGSAEIVLITCGRGLAASFATAERLRQRGDQVLVVNVPTLQPINVAELGEVLSAASAVCVIAGHPLAEELLPRAFESYVPPARVQIATEPTVNCILDAVNSSAEADGSLTAGMAPLADRLNQLGTENAFVVLAQVNALKAEGRDIVSFAIGEPDFPTPANIKKAGVEAITSDKTHYSESQGIPELREAIADYIRRTRDIDVGPKNVVVTPGAKPIMFNTMMSIVNPGDEVIYPNPGFPIYESLVEFIGAKAVPMPLWESLDFNFDPEEFRGLVTPQTKLIVLNSPQNPTGSVLTQEALQAVADIAIERNLWVLSDEVYSQMVYDDEFRSIASIPGMLERTVILDGFSKTYSMTGWRLGFGVMPEELASWQARIETNLNSCTATFTQWAGVEALTGDQSESRAMIDEFSRRRLFIHEGLNELPGFSCIMPKGAFYAFPNVTEACRMTGREHARELQEQILYDGNVAVLPRTAFGRPNDGETDQYLRFSYASSMEMIEEGLERLRKLLG